MDRRLIPTSLVCCLLIAACGGGSDSATTTTSSSVVVAPVVTQAVVPATEAPVVPTTIAMVFDGATVVVANGNIVGGSAGRMTDALALAGFTMGAATNGIEKIDDSIVYYSDAVGAQPVAETLAIKLGGIQVLPLPDPIPTETGTLDAAAVLLVLGNNQADKSLDELGGTSTAPGTTSGITIVVANASGVGGSAGRLSAVLNGTGLTMGTPTNATVALTDSVVYYTTTEGAQAAAESLAATLGGIAVEPMPDPIPTDTATVDGDVLLMLGSNQADKTLAELAG